LAVEKAKAVNMPQDNIQRAIQKGTGELPGTSYEEYIYEGYGPGGVAVLLEIVTDNKNRTAPEIRKAFAKYGGNLGESGCVAWMFEKKGLIQVDTAAADEDRLLGVVLEAGAEDVRRSDDTFEVITAPKDLERVKESLAKEKIEIAEGEVTMLPQSTVRLEGKQAQQMLQLMETLEEHDDVQNVYANFDIPEEIMAAVTG
jgi:YebC/PmpR family DNA-binding regulatory protein